MYLLCETLPMPTALEFPFAWIGCGHIIPNLVELDARSWCGLCVGMPSSRGHVVAFHVKVTITIKGKPRLR